MHGDAKPANDCLDMGTNSHIRNFVTGGFKSDTMETTQKSPATKYLEILYEVETCLQRPLLGKTQKKEGVLCHRVKLLREKYMYPLSETLGQYSSGIERNSHQYYTWHVCSSVTVLPRLAYIYPEKNNVCHMTLFVAGIILD